MEPHLTPLSARPPGPSVSPPLAVLPVRFCPSGLAVYATVQDQVLHRTFLTQQAEISTLPGACFVIFIAVKAEWSGV